MIKKTSAYFNRDSIMLNFNRSIADALDLDSMPNILKPTGKK